ncbi:hypothetical protein BHM03_00038750 [Ensete ventricosum]|nr:hypothetical protein BHM03_00038750 [Ensete ventricosum]
MDVTSVYDESQDENSINKMKHNKKRVQQEDHLRSKSDTRRGADHRVPKEKIKIEDTERRKKWVWVRRGEEKIRSGGLHVFQLAKSVRGLVRLANHDAPTVLSWSAPFSECRKTSQLHILA